MVAEATTLCPRCGQPLRHTTNEHKERVLYCWTHGEMQERRPAVRPRSAKMVTGGKPRTSKSKSNWEEKLVPTNGERIAQLRQARVLSQWKLARVAGVSRGFVKRAEQGSRVYRLPLETLAGALGVEVSELQANTLSDHGD